MIKRIGWICLIYLACLKLSAANPLDSIRNLITTSDNDSIKIQAYTQLAFGYMNKPAEALAIISDMLRFSKSIKSKQLQALCKRKIGVLYHRLNYFDKALEFYLESADVFTQLDDKNGVANCYNNIANAFASKGELTNDVNYYNRAIDYHLKCIKLRQESDTTQLSNSYNNIGIAYMNKGEYSTAIDYYNKAYKIYSRQKEGSNGVDMVTVNLGEVYLRLALKERKDEYFQKAMGYFKDRLDAYKLQGPNQNHANALMKIGQLLCETGQCREAMKFLYRALDMSKQIKNKNLTMQCSGLLATANEKQGNLTEAVLFMRQYNQLKDSIINERNTATVEQMQALYESSQKDEAIQALKIANDLEKMKVNKQRTALFTMIGGIAFLLILGFVLFNRYNIKRKANVQLARAYQSIEIKNNQITDSINYARRIQTAILPPIDVIRKHLSDTFVFYSPKDIVSGDFYWFTHHNSQNFIAVADCAGHGVPGALMSMIGNTLLNEIVNQKNITDPGLILKHLNEGVIKALRQSGIDIMEQDDGMDICVCRVDETKNNKLVYASANLSLFVVNKGSVKSLDSDIFSIGGGMAAASKVFVTKTEIVEPGSMVIMSTDGYYDQFGGSRNSKFLISNFEKLLSETENSADASQLLKTRFENWRGDKHQTDDVLVLGFKI